MPKSSLWCTDRVRYTIAGVGSSKIVQIKIIIIIYLYILTFSERHDNRVEKDYLNLLDC